MRIIQATALLLAVALTVIAMPAQARSYPCWLVRWYATHHTREEIEAIVKKRKVTDGELAEAAKCFKEKK